MVILADTDGTVHACRGRVGGIVILKKSGQPINGVYEEILGFTMVKVSYNLTKCSGNPSDSLQLCLPRP